MTNVDFDFLFEKTGQKILPEHMLDIRDRQAMRVITDFLAGSNPVDAVANGRYWLDKVYEAGYEAGARNARDEFRTRILDFFQLPIVGKKE